ncbi:MAG TPA: LptF/LptG family permease [Tepidisphaeraceae bacterium]|nr:LptF/LptG family permease [Tepidisphaeraceae bacterium]
MSKTLFWYVFKDLLKIFLMTSLVLAGIMSFGGLLKPMMQYGLNGSQMAKMVLYLLPAMQTYSLPIAALFATTIVYGRLAADNELTACRAGGISHMNMLVPAVVLALVLSITSLLCLCFVVPRFTLKVEKVAFDSLAEMVKKRFDRKHEITLDKKTTVYADSVDILPPPPDRPNDEVIVLNGPVFYSYDRDEKAHKNQGIVVPTEFYTARRAIAVIQRDDNQVRFIAQLEGGASFPREFKGSTLGGVEVAQFGPIDLKESLIRENTKFMDIQQLKKLYYDPMRSRKIRDYYNTVTQREQELAFFNTVASALNRTAQYRFQGVNESYLLQLDPEIKLPAYTQGESIDISSAPGSQSRQIRLQRISNGEIEATDEARRLSLRIQADPYNDQINLVFRLEDVLVSTQAAQQPPRRSFAHQFQMPMPAELAAYKTERKPDYYMTKGTIKDDSLTNLRKEIPSLQSDIVAEIHGRVSFAVSCLILVIIGCALGMMFKTGNYLSAFALSVIPALLCIALMVTGQHVIENQSNLLKLGLATIWSGNAIVLCLAAGLLGHLRRQ